MGINVTKGGLVQAIIKNKKTGKEVKCMFNPYEYTLSKSNRWSAESTKGIDVPKSEFVQGGAKSLKLTLHFDTLAENTSVTNHTRPLWKMMLIEPSTINPKNKKGEPPHVEFSWGGVVFEGAIFSMTEKFILFNEQGIPVRSVVDITIQEVDDQNPPEQIGAGASQSATVPVIATAGQRLDNIVASAAQNAAQDLSAAVRKAAEASNIPDPLKPIVGSILRV